MMNTDADTIRERAYEIWEHEGRPHGRDFDHWLQAEREFIAPNKTAKRARPAKDVAAAPAAKRATRPRMKRAH